MENPSETPTAEEKKSSVRLVQSNNIERFKSNQKLFHKAMRTPRKGMKDKIK